MIKIDELCRTVKYSFKAISYGAKTDVFLHNESSNGKLIGILPYRTVGDDIFEYMLISETIGCWDMKPTNVLYTSDGFTYNDSAEGLAAEEFNELTGYNISPSNLVSLRRCRVSKTSDSLCYLYTINLTNVSFVHKDTNNNVYWTATPDASPDPLVALTYLKMQHYLR